MTRSSQLEGNIKALFTAFKAAAVIELTKQTIATDALASSGKVLPAQGKVRSGIMDPDDTKLYVPITKVASERQEVTGIVLQPEVTDGHGDIMSAEVIENAAGDFLAAYNKATKLGFMHKEFTKRFELRQSYIMPGSMPLGNVMVKQGSWVMVVKVLDAKIWKSVKDGKITGFSIGGKAKTVKLEG